MLAFFNMWQVTKKSTDTSVEILLPNPTKIQYKNGIITLCLAALTSNAFNAADILAASDLFGSQSPRIMVLKYASSSIFLLASFLCSSMAVGFLVDANFLINAIGEFAPGGGGYTEAVVERGFAVAVVGNRVFCMALPLMLWLFGRCRWRSPPPRSCGGSMSLILLLLSPQLLFD
ncbi:hypothetical protein SASPL_157309 [Salvia splendens]|uniref:Uncharacterized protein n=1 Tax=Salvia splendens TaxID=180675 RepID=A0A8X8VV56_SALSN|nr:hypothetical protein SASPL_157309 [Salvia splendens]